LPVFNDFTPEVIRLVACSNDIMLFHTSFYSGRTSLFYRQGRLFRR
jgi:hypothetical protein